MVPSLLSWGSEWVGVPFPRLGDGREGKGREVGREGRPQLDFGQDGREEQGLQAEPVFRGWMNGSGGGREDWAGDRDLVGHLCAGGNRGFEGGGLPGVCEEKWAQDSPGEGGL